MDVVHDMRVAARRLRAALALLGDEDLASLEPEVKALQDALGVVRDSQVQGKWLEKAGLDGKELAATLQSARQGRSTSLESALRAWSIVACELNQLIPAHAARLGRLGDRRTGEAIRAQLARVDTRIGRVLANASPRSVHRLRIQAKKLRYAVELVEPGHPKAAKALLERLKPLLDQLGELHDIDVRVAMLQRADGKVQGLLHGTEQSRLERADRLVAELRKWSAEDLCVRFGHAFRRRKWAKRLAHELRDDSRKGGESAVKEAPRGTREIERKFLVRPGAVAGLSGVPYRQGYLAATPSCSIRVRVCNQNARLTIKGSNEGLSRAEWEYSIAREDAEALLRLSPWPVVEKTRYELRVGSRTWEIDEFHGSNEGLVVGEIELEREDDSLERPEWVLEEVSDDPRFYNVNLAQHPYRDWARERA